MNTTNRTPTEETTMTIISSLTDIRTWVGNTNPGNIQSVEELFVSPCGNCGSRGFTETPHGIVRGCCREAGDNQVEPQTASEQVARAIQAADHPGYGADWSKWLDTHAEQLALDAVQS